MRHARAMLSFALAADIQLLLDRFQVVHAANANSDNRRIGESDAQRTTFLGWHRRFCDSVRKRLYLDNVMASKRHTVRGLTRAGAGSRSLTDQRR